MGCVDEDDYLSGDDQDTVQVGGEEEEEEEESDQVEEECSSSEGDDPLAEFTPAQISTILAAASNSKRRCVHTFGVFFSKKIEGILNFF